MKRKSTRTLAVIVAVVMAATACVSVALFNPETTYAAGTVPSGNFNPKVSMLTQGDYDPDMYYVFYNGDFNTKMIDPGNKAIGDEGEFDKATVLVAKNQFIEYVDDSASTQTLAQWIAAEETAQSVDIGSVGNQGDDAIWINLHGETVIPGLYDSHLHLEMGGATRYSPDIFWKSLAEIKIIIRNEVAKTVPGTRITAMGWNQTLETWNGGNTDFPTKEDLDEVSPDNVVVLSRTDGHANWANSLAIRMSPYGGGTLSGGVVTPGPTDPTQWPINNPSDPLYANPNGGAIIRDANGLATGVFVDSAMSPVSQYSSAIPSATASSDADRSALSADAYLRSYGITSFQEAGAGVASIERYKRLYQQGKMKSRGYILVSNGTSSGTDTQADVAFRTTYGNDGITPGAVDYRLIVKGTKTSLDGALGSRGATLFEPYSDAGTAEVPTGWTGASLRFADQTVYEMVKRNLDAGWNIAFHAIGDKTNDQAISAFETYLTSDAGLSAPGALTQGAVEALGFRPRIEHYQITSKGAIERSADINLTASMQFVHATSDMSMAGDRVGEARLQYSYAWRKIINAGMVIANGTDWSVDLLNPYHGLSAGVTRMDRDGTAPKSPRGVGVPWNPITTSISKASDERVTRAEAVHYYSWGGAYGEFSEDFKGTLEVGKLADFVVLDRDYFDPAECKDSDIKDINALLTVIGGEIVYGMERPIIITDEVGDARVGAAYAFTVTGNTDNSPTYNWKITDRDSALKWLKLDYHSGALSGTPTKAGTYEFDVTAANYLGEATVTLSITVNPKDSPVVTQPTGPAISTPPAVVKTTETPVAPSAVPGVSVPVTPGVATTLPASLTFSDGTSADVTWTAGAAGDTGKATIGADGKLTGTVEGKVTLTAVSKTDPTKKVSVTITIAKNVTKVRTPLTTLYLNKGKAITPPVCADSKNAATGKADTSAKLTWKSSNTKVATVNATTGKITPKKKGKATITATALNGKKLTIKVNVVTKATTLKKVTLTKPPKTLKVGKTAILKVKATPAKATNLLVKFSSSKKSVLSVDKAGKITALKKGTAKVTVKIGKKKYVLTVKVK